MATITRNDLANRLRERFGLTTADAYKMIDVVFDEICESLINGEEVKFAGFGSFFHNISFKGAVFDGMLRIFGGPQTEAVVVLGS